MMSGYQGLLFFWGLGFRAQSFDNSAWHDLKITLYCMVPKAEETWTMISKLGLDRARRR